MTGWGQDGPLAATAGHDITYLAISGLLHGIGPADGPPVPPINYLADFGGGAMFLATGAARRPAARARHRRGPGGRRGDDRGCRVPRLDDPHVPGSRRLEGRPRREHARRWRAELPLLRMRGRQVRRGRCPRAAVLGRARRRPGPGRRRDAISVRPGTVGRLRDGAGGDVRARSRATSGRDLRATRRVRRAGVDARRGARPSAQRRARRRSPRSAARSRRRLRRSSPPLPARPDR